VGKEAKALDYKRLTTASAVAVLVIAILFIPMIPLREAYSETEEYERTANYEVVSVVFREMTGLPDDRVYHLSLVIVKNIDAQGGTFMATHYLYDANGLRETRTTGEYISAGQNKTFRAEFDTQGLQDVSGGYSVSPPVFIDRRVVTRAKTVYKSIIELLIYR